MAGAIPIGRKNRRFEKGGLVHGSHLLLQSIPRTVKRSRFIGVLAWCGVEHKRDPKLDKIVETKKRITCLSCIARKFIKL